MKRFHAAKILEKSYSSFGSLSKWYYWCSNIKNYQLQAQFQYTLSSWDFTVELWTSLLLFTPKQGKPVRSCIDSISSEIFTTRTRSHFRHSLSLNFLLKKLSLMPSIFSRRIDWRSPKLICRIESPNQLPSLILLQTKFFSHIFSSCAFLRFVCFGSLS